MRSYGLVILLCLVAAWGFISAVVFGAVSFVHWAWNFWNV